MLFDFGYKMTCIFKYQNNEKIDVPKSFEGDEKLFMSLVIEWNNFVNTKGVKEFKKITS